MTLEEEISLIEKAKENPKFFEPLYNYYFKDVYLFIFNRVGDKNVAGDLTSQVFLNSLQNVNKYKFIGFRMSAWLTKIADNEVKYYFRKNHRIRNITITDQALENLGEVVDEPDNDNLLNALSRILKNLEEEALQLIELRFFENKSFKEIGYVLDITENNAKVRTYRVLDKLRSNMSHEKV